VASIHPYRIKLSLITLIIYRLGGAGEMALDLTGSIRFRP